MQVPTNDYSLDGTFVEKCKKYTSFSSSDIINIYGAWAKLSCSGQTYLTKETTSTFKSCKSIQSTFLTVIYRLAIQTYAIISVHHILM